MDPCSGSQWHCGLLKLKQTRYLMCLANVWALPPLKMKRKFFSQQRAVMSACQFLLSWTPVSCNPEAEGTRYWGPFRSVLEICNKYPLFFDELSTDSGGNHPLIIKEIKSLVLFFKENLFSCGICGLFPLGGGTGRRSWERKRNVYRTSRTYRNDSTLPFHYLICH